MKPLTVTEAVADLRPAVTLGWLSAILLLCLSVACGCKKEGPSDTTGDSPGYFIQVSTKMTGDTLDLLHLLRVSGGSRKPLARVDREVLDVDFGTDDGRARIVGEPYARAVSKWTPHDGFVRYEAEPDNLFVWECNLDAASVTHVQMAGLRVKDARGPVHLLWQSESQPDVWHHAAFMQSFDGERHDPIVPVENHPTWRGRIARMALQFGIPRKKVAEFGHGVPIEIAGVLYRELDLGSSRKADDLPPEIDRLAIARETRRVAYAPAPSRYAVDLETEIPEGSSLDFGIGVHPSNATKAGDGVEFVVSFERGDEQTVLYRRTLDVKHVAADRNWIDASVDLAAIAGFKGRLVFETLPLGDAVADDAMWAHPQLVAPRAPGPPNLIMVSLDTVRADRLGCYGYETEYGNTTPNLDKFAESAILFEDANSTAPETVSAHMSLFTGLLPYAHGIFQVYEPYTLSDKIPTLAELLAKQHYATAAFTEGGGMHYTVGFDRGFDRYSIGKTATERPQKLVEGTFRDATAWLRANADRRFFLLVHSYEAHTPYDPPAPYDTMFYPDYEGPVKPPLSAESVENLVIREQIEYGDDGCRRIESLYDGALCYLDEHVGRFIEEIERLDLVDETIIIFFSDHGEDFFDHFSMASHGHSLYEEMVHVPLIVKIPGVEGPMRIDEPVSLLDVMPTILDRCGIPLPPVQQGVSLMPLLRGGKLPERPIFYEDPTGIPRRGVRSGVIKRIFSPGIQKNSILDLIERFAHVIKLDRFEGILEELEVYHLGEDPEERRNLVAGDRPDRPEPYLKAIREEQDRRNLKIANDLPRMKGSKASAMDMQRLKDLGYVIEESEETAGKREGDESGDAPGKPPEYAPKSPDGKNLGAEGGRGTPD